MSTLGGEERDGKNCRGLVTESFGASLHLPWSLCTAPPPRPHSSLEVAAPSPPVGPHCHPAPCPVPPGARLARHCSGPLCGYKFLVPGPQAAMSKGQTEARARPPRRHTARIHCPSLGPHICHSQDGGAWRQLSTCPPFCSRWGKEFKLDKQR